MWHWWRLAPVIGMPVESAFTRFFVYVFARIARRHSYPGYVGLEASSAHDALHTLHNMRFSK